MRYLKYVVLLAVAAAAILFLAFYGPIPQPLWYHNFSDQRAILGIPHFFNVLSNIFFLIIGLFGLDYVFRKSPGEKQTFIHSPERLFYIIFFVGVFLVAFGSGYYHWNPNNTTLIWDRFSIGIAFMSLFAAMIGERINYRLGLYLLFPLVALGIASVGYWHYSESIGQGDLRFYIIVQYVSLLLFPIILLLFKPTYTKSYYIWLAFLSYFLAKIVEAYDHGIYDALHYTMSGHTLKHLLAALGSYFILVYLKTRKPLAR